MLCPPAVIKKDGKIKERNKAYQRIVYQCIWILDHIHSRKSQKCCYTLSQLDKDFPRTRLYLEEKKHTQLETQILIFVCSRN